MNENKALTKKKQWAPYESKCTVNLLQDGAALAHRAGRVGRIVGATAGVPAKGLALNVAASSGCSAHAPVVLSWPSAGCRPPPHPPTHPFTPQVCKTAIAKDYKYCQGCRCEGVSE